MSTSTPTSYTIACPYNGLKQIYYVQETPTIAFLECRDKEALTELSNAFKNAILTKQLWDMRTIFFKEIEGTIANANYTYGIQSVTRPGDKPATHEEFVQGILSIRPKKIVSDTEKAKDDSIPLNQINSSNENRVIRVDAIGIKQIIGFNPKLSIAKHEDLMPPSIPASYTIDCAYEGLTEIYYVKEFPKITFLKCKNKEARVQILQAFKQANAETEFHGSPDDKLREFVEVAGTIENAPYTLGIKPIEKSRKKLLTHDEIIQRIITTIPDENISSDTEKTENDSTDLGQINRTPCDANCTHTKGTIKVSVIESHKIVGFNLGSSEDCHIL